MQREQDLTNIESTVTDIQEVFADLASIVNDQDEGLDCIEANVDATVKDTNEAVRELEQAFVYQQKSRKCMTALFCVLITLVLSIVGLLLARHSS